MGTDATAAAFHALNLPLLVAAVMAAWLLARDVLLPAWRRGELSLRHHGFPAAIVLAFAVDSVQAVYYSIGRMLPGTFDALYYAYGPLAMIRLTVIAAALMALATYAQIAGWRWRWPWLLAGAVGLWAFAFAVLVSW
jgi:hypothetical protein